MEEFEFLQKCYLQYHCHAEDLLAKSCIYRITSASKLIATNKIKVKFKKK